MSSCCTTPNEQLCYLTVGKRIDCPTFANQASEKAWYDHYTALAEKRRNCDERRLYKTSAVWKDLLYPHVTILDIDGWRGLPDIGFYWDNVPITHVEFEQRYGQCTIMYTEHNG